MNVDWKPVIRIGWRGQVARALGFNPTEPKEWPDRLIDRLLTIKLRQGDRAYFEELRIILGHPR